MQYELIKLNTARNALKYIIKAFDIKELYIPYYICPALRIAVNKENCKIINYHIDENFLPMCEFPNDAYVLYPDYFGVCSDIVEDLSKKYKNLIVDNAHSFFSEPKGIASFNSFRKFFPALRNGACLYTKKTLNDDIKIDDFSYEAKILSYKEICINESRLNNQPIKFASKSTLDALSSIDFDFERIRRRKMFEFFNSYFCGDFQLKKNQVPMAYPYISKNADDASKIVDGLSKHNINVYRYWNNLPQNYPERIFYENMLVISLNAEEFDSDTNKLEYILSE